MLYIPLFQSCVFNFNEKIKQFHGINMTDYIPQNFLTLSVSMKTLKESVIRAKYPEELSNKMLSLKKDIEKISEETANNPVFAINIVHQHYLTKDKSKADVIIAIDKNSNDKAKILKEVKDINNTHPYTMTRALEAINNSLTTKNLIEMIFYYLSNTMD